MLRGQPRVPGLFRDDPRRAAAAITLWRPSLQHWNDHVKRLRRWVQKVSVAAGFTCPNRDGALGCGGCTFCNMTTPGYLDRHGHPHPDRRGLQHWTGAIRKYALLPHQSYSNTYGSSSACATTTRCLRTAGSTGSSPWHAAGLPDAVLDHLAELARTHIIELEIGVDLRRRGAAAAVGRGHDFACSADAIRRASRRRRRRPSDPGSAGPSRRASMLEGAAQLALPVRALAHQLARARRRWLATGSAVRPACPCSTGYIELADFVRAPLAGDLLQHKRMNSTVLHV